MGEVQKLYSYDEVPYPNNPFAQSHPDRLATIATLFGMSPKPIDQCRVLELGCGRGGNLIPMAEQLPGSEFVGIELSQVQFTEAQQCVQEVGLTNIDLKHMNILDVDDRIGQFDYIISHGVFSWVPTAVQDKILDTCAAALAPQGVAYISYNTYPGWSIRGMIRDMMYYHTSQFEDPQQRIQQSRGLLDFLAHNAPDNTAFGMALRAELKILCNCDDGYLYHEHLEDVNDPIYFHQFAKRIEARGLQYLGEAEMAVMYSGHLTPTVAQTLQRVASDLIQMEQYMDFVRNRVFRQTLLCRQDIRLDRELKPNDLAPLFVSCPLVPAKSQSSPIASDSLELAYRGQDQVVSTVRVPIMKAAAISLAEVWPGGFSFPELVSRAAAMVNPEALVTAERRDGDTESLGKSLLEFYVAGLVELQSQPFRFEIAPSARPLASRVARFQARSGNLVTNLRHERQRLSEFGCQLIGMLDGKRDRSQLVDALMERVSAGELILQRPVASEHEARSRLTSALEDGLNYLSRAALMVRTAPMPARDEPSTDEQAFGVASEQRNVAVGAGPNWDGLLY